MQFPEKIPGNYWELAYSIICHNMPNYEIWVYSKKPHWKWGFSTSTRGRTRTGTVLLPTDFKSAPPPSRNMFFAELYRTFYEVSSIITTWISKFIQLIYYHSYKSYQFSPSENNVIVSKNLLLSPNKIVSARASPLNWIFSSPSVLILQ